jgi:chemotaxis protein MotB
VAGKGGGAWKVAYADFVTAMMAFFLVMWLVGQDQSVKKAVAFYFQNPNSVSEIGTSKTPEQTGSLPQFQIAGNVPTAESVALGRGRKPYSQWKEVSRATKMVGDWIHADKAASEYWREQARSQRARARESTDVVNKLESVESVAILMLSKKLKLEILGSAPKQANQLYKDLLHEIIDEVNWTQIAQDLLLHY